MATGVLCIFSPLFESDPVTLILGTESSRERACFLDYMFYLAITLGMVARGKVY